MAEIITIKFVGGKAMKNIMKATGIVRRIDPCVIIGQEPANRITTGILRIFVQKILLKTLILVDLIKQKARRIDKLYIHHTN